jgi:hypothetical protein
MQYIYEFTGAYLLLEVTYTFNNSNNSSTFSRTSSMEEIQIKLV